jgi:hypothetical protein
MGIADPIGVSLTTADTTPAFSLGQVARGNTGDAYLYVKANTAITGAGYIVTVDASYGADMLSTSNDARGNLVGAACVAIPANSYGWVQTKGTTQVMVLASCAANVRLDTTATAGNLDDDGTAGSFSIEGLYLTTARAASAGLAPARLNDPFVSAVL